MTVTASPFNENQPRKPNRHPAHLFIRHPATVSARFTQIETHRQCENFSITHVRLKWVIAFKKVLALEQWRLKQVIGE
jgi:hypothetical protein